MALVGGFSAFLTRFIVLVLIAAIAGEHGIIQGGSGFAFVLASVLLILVAYLPAGTIEKREEQKAWDIPMPRPMKLATTRDVRPSYLSIRNSAQNIEEGFIRLLWAKSTKLLYPLSLIYET